MVIRYEWEPDRSKSWDELMNESTQSSTVDFLFLWSYGLVS